MHSGYLKDILTEYGPVVQYTVTIGEAAVPLNHFIGQPLRLSHHGQKACVFCGRKVNKLFANGSCYPCFSNLPQNDLCILKPHECHYDTCRNQAWGDANCMIPTYVYIAKSSDVKIGISRSIPKRWMDQGAVEAMPIALMPTRKMAGELEFFLSKHMPDKTDWRKMLKGEVSEASLSTVRERVLELMPEEFKAYVLEGQPITEIAYPMEAGIDKVTSHNLDKAPAEGRLIGIKAKYIILDTGVLNLSKFAGYWVDLSVGAEVEAAVTAE